jgi:putative ABC transport system permease protein
MNAIIFKYNWRSMLIRKTSTVITIGSIAFTSFVLLLLLGVAEGFRTCLNNSGEPLNLLALRDGTRRELDSSIDREMVPIVEHLNGVALDSKRLPLVSPEITTRVTLRKTNGTDVANVMVRGVGAQGIALRPNFKIIEGQMFHSGMREIIVAHGISARLQAASIGETVNFSKSRWKIVGVFEAPGTVFDSEMWTDADTLAQDMNRRSYSSVLLRATNLDVMDQLKKLMLDDKRLRLRTETQKVYFESLNQGARPIEIFAVLIAAMMGLSAFFAAMNSIHTAIARRSREIRTLRILGFSQRRILGLLLAEAALIAGAGGLVACIASIPLNFISAVTTNFVTLSTLVFTVHISLLDMSVAVVFAILVGCLGSVLPAWWILRGSGSSAFRSA